MPSRRTFPPSTMAKTPNPALDAARAAFDGLGTQDKTAFLFEAAFGTIGQAIQDTGRSVSDAIDRIDLDSLFREPAAPAAPPAAPPSASAPPPPAPPPKPPRPPKPDPLA